MDAVGFDALTRALTSSASSRRRLLTRLAGSALGALAMALGVTVADATHFGCYHVGKRCTRSRQCCSSRCRGPRGRKTCRAHHMGTCTAEKAVCAGGGIDTCGADCACYRTTGGANYCGSNGAACVACKTDAECVSVWGIPGSACVDHSHDICTDGCAPGIPTGCVRPCTT
jgi:hypothetical protein